ncbi:hypothetical protein ACFYTG_16655 [Streptomyces mirabilis]|uniref:hypothetical protein n=1 Tax=Streptomyces mirabilis TaxID=68239 RepID=UPI00367FA256
MSEAEALAPVRRPRDGALGRNEPSDLAVAIRIGQKMLDAYGQPDYGDSLALAQAHGALTETVRILLCALGAEGGEQL